ncbi:hypothetical protein C0993_007628 [Termitomyces sp. T159_Od127]|nr:hypothetical protein C0993_007628 [Termitomyces sp. T159_Od127]
MRARIALRRSLGREPTPQEVASSYGRGVTADDVRRALDSGVERLQVMAMKCVGYDEVFQMELRDKSLTWKPPPKTETAKSRKKKGVNQIQREMTDDEVRDEGVEVSENIKAGVDKSTTGAVADEALNREIDPESDREVELSLSENTPTMHGVKRKRQDPMTLTSTTVLPADDTSHSEHRPRRVKLMPSRDLLE